MLTTLLAPILMNSQAPVAATVRVPLAVEFLATTGVVESQPISAGMDWDEVVVSWNVSNPDQAWLKVEVQALWPERNSRWYTLADWTGNMAKGPRASVPDQKDGDGEVQIDLLQTARSCQTLRIRLTTRKTAEGSDPKLKLLCVNFFNSKAKPHRSESVKSAWGKTLDVPPRAQGPYEFGRLQYDPDRVSEGFKTWFSKVKEAQYCSPASVSMVSGHWAKELGRRELDCPVPRAIESVFDEKYPGTGNWPFNTALLGSLEGMRAYVARLADVADLERLIDAGIPVVCSVSANLLKGKPAKEDGHLVVLIGFDREGNPVFNDPGDSSQIRRTYLRQNFQKAWNYSKRTVYVCHPERMKLPKSLAPSVLVD